jgi:crotonobetainyl-CoA:carnitine CoA-transferase CaiB-like acyl-CoA transferase
VTQPAPQTAGPLSGLRIVDLTTVLMGPLATRILGDLGADVVRVEAPGGDELRNLGPKRSDHMGWFTLNLQRNKRSIVLDLKSDADREQFLELIAVADVCVTNLRASAIERLKITYAHLSRVNPDLIYCVANGFGSDGPYADRTAYDDVIQSVSGLASVAGWQHDSPEYMPTLIADKVAALHIVYAVLAAVVQRATVGGGDLVEVPMAEALASFTLVEHLAGHTFQPAAGPIGYERLRSRHRRPRRASDGWICVLPYTDRNWVDFLTEAGRPDAAHDERFRDRATRTLNGGALYQIVDDVLRTRTVAEWLTACEALSVPAAPVNELEDLADDPHFAAVGLLTDADHPTEGRYRRIKNPVRFARSTNVYAPAPKLGQNNEEVRAEVRVLLARRRRSTSPPDAL